MKDKTIWVAVIETMDNKVMAFPYHHRAVDFCLEELHQRRKEGATPSEIVVMMQKMRDSFQCGNCHITEYNEKFFIYEVVLTE